MCFGIECIRGLRRFVVVPDVLVVLDVVGDEDFRWSVFGASLEHVNLSFVEHDLGVDTFQAFMAEA